MLLSTGMPPRRERPAQLLELSAVGSDHRQLVGCDPAVEQRLAQLERKRELGSVVPAAAQPLLLAGDVDEAHGVGEERHLRAAGPSRGVCTRKP